MQRVRRARPHSIQTQQQEEYVRSRERLGSKSPVRPEAENVLACLLGGALGDAFGYTIEFISIENIRRQFGRAGLEQPVFENGKLSPQSGAPLSFAVS